MVTRLKNSRKFAVVLMIAVILCAACGMVASYPAFSEEMKPELNGETVNEGTLENIARSLIGGNYFLYNEVYEESDVGGGAEIYSDDDFFLFRKYMDCEVFDEKSKALTGENDENVLRKLAKNNTSYAFRVAFLFDEDGGFKEVEVGGTGLNEAEQFRIENLLYTEQRSNSYEYLESPSGVKIIYGFTKENLMKYEREYDYAGMLYAMDLSTNRTYRMFEWGLIFFVAGAALLIPCNKAWRIEEMKIFRAPAELVLLLWLFAVGGNLFYAEVVWNTLGHSMARVAERIGFTGTLDYGIETVVNVFMWFCVFAIVYWGVTCLRGVFTMKKAFWKERTLCAKAIAWCRKGNDRYGDKVKQGAADTVGFARRIWKKIKKGLHDIYDGLLHVDFQDRTNQTIIRIVVINFIVLLIITCFWFYGIVALLIYSILLFLFLQKYFGDIRKKYALLLQSTNLLAEGNLDVAMEEDMGIFNPIKQELQKVREGFKKAVQEEVKSERMKTELITNVSHDLKTPLTAIITYVDLLKQEKDEEKRKEYLGILERKSLRLKVLIEDLFEISKATSRNVTMNFMQVDIVGLLKQVGFECDNKIQEAHLDFRWNLPDEKVVLMLDSQKTYRIFENLIVNITKYAMPHTRVYIDLRKTEDMVAITMKNVSAAELNFNTNEITDRFVRGDAARNTEGSGLGLAIAKSFTELQHGTLKISTDADLFKAEIRLPYKGDTYKGDSPF